MYTPKFGPKGRVMRLVGYRCLVGIDGGFPLAFVDRAQCTRMRCARASGYPRENYRAQRGSQSLTPPNTTTTMHGMSKDVLVQMLTRVAGLQRDGSVFVAKTGHQITVYIGEPGRAMAISDVERIELREAHMEVTAKSRGTLYCSSDATFAVADNPEGAGRTKRAGFGLD